MSLSGNLRELVTDCFDNWASLGPHDRRSRLDNIRARLPAVAQPRFLFMMAIHEHAPFGIRNRLVYLLDASEREWLDAFEGEQFAEHVAIATPAIVSQALDGDCNISETHGFHLLTVNGQASTLQNLITSALSQKIKSENTYSGLVRILAQINRLTELNPAFPAHQIDALRHCASVESVRIQRVALSSSLTDALLNVDRDATISVLKEVENRFPEHIADVCEKVALDLAGLSSGRGLSLLREYIPPEQFPTAIITEQALETFKALLDSHRIAEARAHWSSLCVFSPTPEVKDRVAALLRDLALKLVYDGNGAAVNAISQMRLEFCDMALDSFVFETARETIKGINKTDPKQLAGYCDNISPAISEGFQIQWDLLRANMDAIRLVGSTAAQISHESLPGAWITTLRDLAAKMPADLRNRITALMKWASDFNSESLHLWPHSCPVSSLTGPHTWKANGGVELAAVWLKFCTALKENAHDLVLRVFLENRQWGQFDLHLQSNQWGNDRRAHWMTVKANAVVHHFKTILPLDPAQARIVASPAKTIRVTARAGSGKTRLLTALAYFLVDQCGCQPDEVLLLAFNRKAADELEDRLMKLLKVPAFPGARTFHSLAYGIVQPEEAVLMDQGDEVQSRELTRCIQDILRANLDDILLDKIYQVFRRETSIDDSLGTLLSGEARYDYRRSLKNVTLGGYLVKSAGEKFIGDFLFEHGVRHYYEDPVRWEASWYRPDFKIMTGEKTYVILEHWAVNPDAPYSSSTDWSEQEHRKYQQSAKRKRAYWETKGITLIETLATDCHDRESFELRLTALLRPYIPQLSRLPKEKLLNLVKEIHLSRLAQWLAQGVQRSQKQGWDAAALATRLDDYTPGTERERLFLELLRKVFFAYEPKIVAERKTDFDRLFNRAIAIMREDPSRALLKGPQVSIDLSKLRYCLVDEAQDLSPQFIEALTCLRDLNPALRLVFVGDDWQAINRFAGSDVELFNAAITTDFGKCATPNLTTNYRSARNVVEAGNRLMAGQGEPAMANANTPGRIEMAFLDQVWIEYREAHAQTQADQPFKKFRGGAGTLMKTIYQLAIPDLNAGRTVGVIFRKNLYYGMPILDLERGFIGILRAMRWPRSDVTHWQRNKIRFSTAHKFKGGECDTVFVVEPHAGAFPLLNAASIELFRFFGETIAQAEGDERRLFYVAMTRAKERLVFLSEKIRWDEESPYLDPIRDMITLISVPNIPLQPEPSSQKAPDANAAPASDEAQKTEDQDDYAPDDSDTEASDYDPD